MRRRDLPACAIGNDFRKAHARRWKLRFEPCTAPFVEPVMGWTGGTDTLSQIELDFCSGRGAFARADRRRAGRPGAVVHAPDATAAGRRPTLRMPR
jgi:hypothetical protein